MADKGTAEAITGATTLDELETFARRHRLISIHLERPPNDRSGVAARVERSDRVIVTKSGATVADAIAMAAATIATIPYVAPAAQSLPIGRRQ